jgi:hypothetical protein
MHSRSLLDAPLSPRRLTHKHASARQRPLLRTGTRLLFACFCIVAGLYLNSRIADAQSDLSTGWTKRNEVVNDNISTHLYSHAKPFNCANGDLIAGFSTNEDSGVQDYKLVRSTDGGQTWGSKVTVGTAASNIFEGGFAQMSATNLVVVYGNGDGVTSRRSADNGQTWGSPLTILAEGTSGGVDSHPDITRLPNNTLIVGYSKKGDIIARISTNGGASWGAEINVAKHISGSYQTLSVVTETDGSIVVAFLDATDLSGAHRIFITHSTNGGSGWTAPTLAREGIFDISNDPNLTVLNNGDLALWLVVGTEASGARTDYVVISHDKGQTWGCESCVYCDIDTQRNK